MNKITEAVFLFMILLVAAALLVPWRNVNWGKISYVPAETITVTGEAKSFEKNQIASYNAGVDAVNDNKDLAIKDVNDKVGAIIKAVKEFGVSEADIKTQSLNIYQNEEMYYDNGVQKSRKGQWRVNNNIEIILRDVSKASALADTLNNSGATNVNGPNFRMDDTTQAERGLYDVAMKDAREKAEIIAKASGRSLGKVLTVNEGSANGSVVPMSAQDSRGGGGAPVEVGSGTVYKTLSVSFDMK